MSQKNAARLLQQAVLPLLAHRAGKPGGESKGRTSAAPTRELGCPQHLSPGDFCAMQVPETFREAPKVFSDLVPSAPTCSVTSSRRLHLTVCCNLPGDRVLVMAQLLHVLLQHHNALW